MNIVKIKKLIQDDGIADYKGLDISLFVANKQLYGKEDAYIVTNESAIPNHPDLTIVDETEYQTFKDSLVVIAPVDPLEELNKRLTLLQNAFDEFTLGV